MLGRQQREIGGEAFAQPHVVPVFFGDRIAEPLVRRLVRHQAEGRPAGDRFLPVEDLAGMLHAAAHAGGLHARQLLVRVRPDAIAVELDGLARGGFEGGDAGVAILMEDPGLERNARGHAEMPRGELRHADIVQPRGDGHGLLPVREAPAVAQVDLFLEQPVGHHLVLGGRGDEEFAGGLVVGMVDDGQPLVRQVGPVDAEEAALAEFVFGHLQPARGNAAILHGELARSPAFGAGGKRHHQAIGPVRVARPRRPKSPPSRSCPCRSAGDARSSENSVTPSCDEAQIDGGLAGDLIVVVVERHAKDVMLRVDARLPRIVVRENL